MNAQLCPKLLEYNVIIESNNQLIMNLWLKAKCYTKFGSYKILFMKCPTVTFSLTSVTLLYGVQFKKY